MNKSFKVLLQKLKDSNPPKQSFAIFGSGPMGVRGIRECRDLDVVVLKQVFYDFGHKARWSLKESANLAYLEKDKIELYKDWGPGEWDIDKLIQEAEIINGLPFVRLEEVVKWKQLKGRKKDKEDIRLINDYLKQGEEQ